MAIWIWLVVAVVAALGEALTYDLFLASVAVAAVIAGFSASILAVPLQVGVFATLSLIGIIFVRPVVKHSLGIESLTQLTDHVRHLTVVGRRAIVTQTVNAHGGQIRIGQGEFWTARSYEPNDTIDVGMTVEVVLVQGVTALVEPVEAPAVQAPADLTSTKGS